MAAGLVALRYGPILRVDSVGVRSGIEMDPLTVEVMDELGADLSRHRPKSFAALDEDAHFDLIVSLSPEAHHRALELIPSLAETAEYWPTFDPSLAEGSRAQRLDEYRLVRDGLAKRIEARFPRPSTG